MAIHVIGATVKRPAEMYVKAALEMGLRDSNGITFEIIRLMPTTAVAEGGTIHGYQDTEIDATDPGHLTIEHRTDRNGDPIGRIKWQQHPVTRMYGAEIAKTPHNIKALATQYYDKSWRILDPVVEAEVKAVADKMLAEMSQKERDTFRKRSAQHSQHQYGGQVVNRAGETIDEVFDKQGDIALNTRISEIKEREQGLEKREKALEQKVSSVVEGGGSVTRYTSEDLMSISSPFSLRKKARTEFGLVIPPTCTKKAIVDMILAKQEENTQAAIARAEAKVEPVVVTG